MKNRIADEIKTSMKAGDKVRVAALRLIMAAIKQKEIDQRKELSDTEIIKILHKLKKQRQESIAQFEKANRFDLRDREQFELDIITAYLPAAMNDSEIDTLIRQAIQQSHAENIRDMGKVMGILNTSLEGKADMAQVSKKVRQQLGG